MADSIDKYPNYPPYDDNIRFYTGSELKINPTGPEKQAKVCPKCSYPIHARVYIKPCMHYFCYDCYANNPKQCQLCNSVACEVIRLGDRDIMYSCDHQCYMVFESQAELQQHQKYHEQLKESCSPTNDHM